MSIRGRMEITLKLSAGIYILTKSLVPLLEKSPDPRVVSLCFMLSVIQVTRRTLWEKLRQFIKSDPLAFFWINHTFKIDLFRVKYNHRIVFFLPVRQTLSPKCSYEVQNVLKNFSIYFEAQNNI